MLSSSGRQWPAGGDWVLQPKWDGFRLNSSLLGLLLHRALPGCPRAAAAGSGEAGGETSPSETQGFCFKARACNATGARTGVQESSGCRRCPYSPGTCESCAYALFATVPSQSVGQDCRLGAACAGGSRLRRRRRSRFVLWIGSAATQWARCPMGMTRRVARHQLSPVPRADDLMAPRRAIGAPSPIVDHISHCAQNGFPDRIASATVA
jgi:hypothetical protein